MEVWSQFFKLFVFRVRRDFMHKALWGRLTLGAKTQKVFHRPKCVLCSVTETLRHALSACRFFPMATNIIFKTFGTNV